MSASPHHHQSLAAATVPVDDVYVLIPDNKSKASHDAPHNTTDEDSNTSKRKRVLELEQHDYSTSAASRVERTDDPSITTTTVTTVATTTIPLSSRHRNFFYSSDGSEWHGGAGNNQNGEGDEDGNKGKASPTNNVNGEATIQRNTSENHQQLSDMMPPLEVAGETPMMGRLPYSSPSSPEREKQQQQQQQQGGRYNGELLNSGDGEISAGASAAATATKPSSSRGSGEDTTGTSSPSTRLPPPISSTLSPSLSPRRTRGGGGGQRQQYSSVPTTNGDAGNGEKRAFYSSSYTSPPPQAAASTSTVCYVGSSSNEKDESTPSTEMTGENSLRREGGARGGGRAAVGRQKVNLHHQYGGGGGFGGHSHPAHELVATLLLRNTMDEGSATIRELATSTHRAVESFETDDAVEGCHSNSRSYSNMHFGEGYDEAGEDNHTAALSVPFTCCPRPPATGATGATASPPTVSSELLAFSEAMPPPFLNAVATSACASTVVADVRGGNLDSRRQEPPAHPNARSHTGGGRGGGGDEKYAREPPILRDLEEGEGQPPTDMMMPPKGESRGWGVAAPDVRGADATAARLNDTTLPSLLPSELNASTTNNANMKMTASATPTVATGTATLPTANDRISAKRPPQLAPPVVQNRRDDSSRVDTIISPAALPNASGPTTSPVREDREGEQREMAKEQEGGFSQPRQATTATATAIPPFLRQFNDHQQQRSGSAASRLAGVPPAFGDFAPLTSPLVSPRSPGAGDGGGAGVNTFHQAADALKHGNPRGGGGGGRDGIEDPTDDDSAPHRHGQHEERRDEGVVRRALKRLTSALFSSSTFLNHTSQGRKGKATDAGKSPTASSSRKRSNRTTVGSSSAKGQRTQSSPSTSSSSSSSSSSSGALVARDFLKNTTIKGENKKKNNANDGGASPQSPTTYSQSSVEALRRYVKNRRIRPSRLLTLGFDPSVVMKIVEESLQTTPVIEGYYFSHRPTEREYLTRVYGMGGLLATIATVIAPRYHRKRREAEEEEEAAKNAKEQQQQKQHQHQKQHQQHVERERASSAVKSQRKQKPAAQKNRRCQRGVTDDDGMLGDDDDTVEGILDDELFFMSLIQSGNNSSDDDENNAGDEEEYGDNAQRRWQLSTSASLSASSGQSPLNLFTMILVTLGSVAVILPTSIDDNPSGIPTAAVPGPIISSLFCLFFVVCDILEALRLTMVSRLKRRIAEQVRYELEGSSSSSSDEDEDEGEDNVTEDTPRSLLALKAENTNTDRIPLSGRSQRTHVHVVNEHGVVGGDAKGGGVASNGKGTGVRSSEDDDDDDEHVAPRLVADAATAPPAWHEDGRGGGGLSFDAKAKRVTPFSPLTEGTRGSAAAAADREYANYDEQHQQEEDDAAFPQQLGERGDGNGDDTTANNNNTKPSATLLQNRSVTVLVDCDEDDNVGSVINVGHTISRPRPPTVNNQKLGREGVVVASEVEMTGVLRSEKTRKVKIATDNAASDAATASPTRIKNRRVESDNRRQKKKKNNRRVHRPSYYEKRLYRNALFGEIIACLFFLVFGLGFCFRYNVDHGQACRTETLRPGGGGGTLAERVAAGKLTLTVDLVKKMLARQFYCDNALTNSFDVAIAIIVWLRRPTFFPTFIVSVILYITFVFVEIFIPKARMVPIDDRDIVPHRIVLTTLSMWGLLAIRRYLERSERRLFESRKLQLAKIALLKHEQQQMHTFVEELVPRIVSQRLLLLGGGGGEAVAGGGGSGAATGGLLFAALRQTSANPSEALSNYYKFVRGGALSSSSSSSFIAGLDMFKGSDYEENTIILTIGLNDMVRFSNDNVGAYVAQTVSGVKAAIMKILLAPDESLARERLRKAKVMRDEQAAALVLRKKKGSSDTAAFDAATALPDRATSVMRDFNASSSAAIDIDALPVNNEEEKESADSTAQRQKSAPPPPSLLTSFAPQFVTNYGDHVIAVYGLVAPSIVNQMHPFIPQNILTEPSKTTSKLKKRKRQKKAKSASSAAKNTSEIPTSARKKSGDYGAPVAIEDGHDEYGLLELGSTADRQHLALISQQQQQKQDNYTCIANSSFHHNSNGNGTADGRLLCSGASFSRKESGARQTTGGTAGGGGGGLSSSASHNHHQKVPKTLMKSISGLTTVTLKSENGYSRYGGEVSGVGGGVNGSMVLTNTANNTAIATLMSNVPSPLSAATAGGPERQNIRPPTLMSAIRFAPLHAMSTTGANPSSADMHSVAAVGAAAAMAAASSAAVSSAGSLTPSAQQSITPRDREVPSAQAFIAENGGLPRFTDQFTNNDPYQGQQRGHPPTSVQSNAVVPPILFGTQSPQHNQQGVLVSGSQAALAPTATPTPGLITLFKQSNLNLSYTANTTATTVLSYDVSESTTPTAHASVPARERRRGQQLERALSSLNNHNNVHHENGNNSGETTGTTSNLLTAASGSGSNNTDSKAAKEAAEGRHKAEIAGALRATDDNPTTTATYFAHHNQQGFVIGSGAGVTSPHDNIHRFANASRVAGAGPHISSSTAYEKELSKRIADLKKANEQRLKTLTFAELVALSRENKKAYVECYRRHLLQAVGLSACKALAEIVGYDGDSAERERTMLRQRRRDLRAAGFVPDNQIAAPVPMKPPYATSANAFPSASAAPSTATPAYIPPPPNCTAPRLCFALHCGPVVGSIPGVSESTWRYGVTGEGIAVATALQSATSSTRRILVSEEMVGVLGPIAMNVIDKDTPVPIYSTSTATEIDGDRPIRGSRPSESRGLRSSSKRRRMSRASSVFFPRTEDEHGRREDAAEAGDVALGRSRRNRRFSVLNNSSFTSSSSSSSSSSFVVSSQMSSVSTMRRRENAAREGTTENSISTSPMRGQGRREREGGAAGARSFSVPSGRSNSSGKPSNLSPRSMSPAHRSPQNRISPRRLVTVLEGPDERVTEDGRVAAIDTFTANEKGARTPPMPVMIEHTTTVISLTAADAKEGDGGHQSVPRTTTKTTAIDEGAQRVSSSQKGMPPSLLSPPYQTSEELYRSLPPSPPPNATTGNTKGGGGLRTSVQQSEVGLPGALPRTPNPAKHHATNESGDEDGGVTSGGEGNQRAPSRRRSYGALTTATSTTTAATSANYTQQQGAIDTNSSIVGSNANPAVLNSSNIHPNIGVARRPVSTPPLDFQAHLQEQQNKQLASLQKGKQLAVPVGEGGDYWSGGGERLTPRSMDLTVATRCDRVATTTEENNCSKSGNAAHLRNSPGRHQTTTMTENVEFSRSPSPPLSHPRSRAGSIASLICTPREGDKSPTARQTLLSKTHSREVGGKSQHKKKRAVSVVDTILEKIVPVTSRACPARGPYFEGNSRHVTNAYASVLLDLEFDNDVAIVKEMAALRKRWLLAEKERLEKERNVLKRELAEVRRRRREREQLRIYQHQLRVAARATTSAVFDGRRYVGTSGGVGGPTDARTATAVTGGTAATAGHVRAAGGSDDVSTRHHLVGVGNSSSSLYGVNIVIDRVPSHHLPVHHQLHTNNGCHQHLPATISTATAAAPTMNYNPQSSPSIFASLTSNATQGQSQRTSPQGGFDAQCPTAAAIGFGVAGANTYPSSSSAAAATLAVAYGFLDEHPAMTETGGVLGSGVGSERAGAKKGSDLLHLAEGFTEGSSESSPTAATATGPAGAIASPTAVHHPLLIQQQQLNYASSHHTNTREVQQHAAAAAAAADEENFIATTAAVTRSNTMTTSGCVSDLPSPVPLVLTTPVLPPPPLCSSAFHHPATATASRPAGGPPPYAYGGITLTTNASSAHNKDGSDEADARGKCKGGGDGERDEDRPRRHRHNHLSHLSADDGAGSNDNVGTNDDDDNVSRCVSISFRYDNAGRPLLPSSTPSLFSTIDEGRGRTEDGRREDDEVDTPIPAVGNATGLFRAISSSNTNTNPSSSAETDYAYVYGRKVPVRKGGGPMPLMGIPSALHHQHYGAAGGEGLHHRNHHRDHQQQQQQQQDYPFLSDESAAVLSSDAVSQLSSSSSSSGLMIAEGSNDDALELETIVSGHRETWRKGGRGDTAKLKREKNPHQSSGKSRRHQGGGGGHQRQQTVNFLEPHQIMTACVESSRQMLFNVTAAMWREMQVVRIGCCGVFEHRSSGSNREARSLSSSAVVSSSNSRSVNQKETLSSLFKRGLSFICCCCGLHLGKNKRSGSDGSRTVSSSKSPTPPAENEAIDDEEERSRRRKEKREEDEGVHGTTLNKPRCFSTTLTCCAVGGVNVMESGKQDRPANEREKNNDSSKATKSANKTPTTKPKNSKTRSSSSSFGPLLYSLFVLPVAEIARIVFYPLRFANPAVEQVDFQLRYLFYSTQTKAFIATEILTIFLAICHFGITITDFYVVFPRMNVSGYKFTFVVPPSRAMTSTSFFSPPSSPSSSFSSIFYESDQQSAPALSVTVGEDEVEHTLVMPFDSASVSFFDFNEAFSRQIREKGEEKENQKEMDTSFARPQFRGNAVENSTEDNSSDASSDTISATTTTATTAAPHSNTTNSTANITSTTQRPKLTPVTVHLFGSVDQDGDFKLSTPQHTTSIVLFWLVIVLSMLNIFLRLYGKKLEQEREGAEMAMLAWQEEKAALLGVGGAIRQQRIDDAAAAAQDDEERKKKRALARRNESAPTKDSKGRDTATALTLVTRQASARKYEEASAEEEVQNTTFLDDTNGMGGEQLEEHEFEMVPLSVAGEELDNSGTRTVISLSRSTSLSSSSSSASFSAATAFSFYSAAPPTCDIATGGSAYPSQFQNRTRRTLASHLIFNILPRYVLPLLKQVMLLLACFLSQPSRPGLDTMGLWVFFIATNFSAGYPLHNRLYTLFSLYTLAALFVICTTLFEFSVFRRVFIFAIIGITHGMVIAIAYAENKERQSFVSLKLRNAYSSALLKQQEARQLVVDNAIPKPLVRLFEELKATAASEREKRRVEREAQRRAYVENMRRMAKEAKVAAAAGNLTNTQLQQQQRPLLLDNNNNNNNAEGEDENEEEMEKRLEEDDEEEDFNDRRNNDLMYACVEIDFNVLVRLRFDDFYEVFASAAAETANAREDESEKADSRKVRTATSGENSHKKVKRHTAIDPKRNANANASGGSAAAPTDCTKAAVPATIAPALRLRQTLMRARYWAAFIAIIDALICEEFPLLAVMEVVTGGGIGGGEIVVGGPWSSNVASKSLAEQISSIRKAKHKATVEKNEAMAAAERMQPQQQQQQQQIARQSPIPRSTPPPPEGGTETGQNLDLTGLLSDPSSASPQHNNKRKSKHGAGGRGGNAATTDKIHPLVRANPHLFYNIPYGKSCGDYLTEAALFVSRLEEICNAPATYPKVPNVVPSTILGGEDERARSVPHPSEAGVGEAENSSPAAAANKKKNSAAERGERKAKSDDGGGGAQSPTLFSALSSFATRGSSNNKGGVSRRGGDGDGDERGAMGEGSKSGVLPSSNTNNIRQPTVTRKSSFHHRVVLDTDEQQQLHSNLSVISSSVFYERALSPSHVQTDNIYDERSDTKKEAREGEGLVVLTETAKRNIPSFLESTQLIDIILRGRRLPTWGRRRRDSPPNTQRVTDKQSGNEASGGDQSKTHDNGPQRFREGKSDKERSGAQQQTTSPSRMMRPTTLADTFPVDTTESEEGRGDNGPQRNKTKNGGGAGNGKRQHPNDDKNGGDDGDEQSSLKSRRNREVIQSFLEGGVRIVFSSITTADDAIIMLRNSLYPSFDVLGAGPLKARELMKAAGPGTIAFTEGFVQSYRDEVCERDRMARTEETKRVVEGRLRYLKAHVESEARLQKILTLLSVKKGLERKEKEERRQEREANRRRKQKEQEPEQGQLLLIEGNGGGSGVVVRPTGSLSAALLLEDKGTAQLPKSSSFAAAGAGGGAGVGTGASGDIGPLCAFGSRRPSGSFGGLLSVTHHAANTDTSPAGAGKPRSPSSKDHPSLLVPAALLLAQQRGGGNGEGGGASGGEEVASSGSTSPTSQSQSRRSHPSLIFGGGSGGFFPSGPAFSSPSTPSCSPNGKSKGVGVGGGGGGVGVKELIVRVGVSDAISQRRDRVAVGGAVAPTTPPLTFGIDPSSMVRLPFVAGGGLNIGLAIERGRASPHSAGTGTTDSNATDSANYKSEAHAVVLGATSIGGRQSCSWRVRGLAVTKMYKFDDRSILTAGSEMIVGQQHRQRDQRWLDDGLQQ